jgi:hypothetical protein
MHNKVSTAVRGGRREKDRRSLSFILDRSGCTIRTMNDVLHVQCPLYLLASTQTCWKCGQSQSVAALGTHSLMDDENQVGDPKDQTDLVFLTNIISMPAEVFEYIARGNQRYMRRHSLAADTIYYANTCECGANFGDFHLFSEPGGAFFPESEADAAQVNYHELPFEGSMPFECSWSHGLGELIIAHGKKGPR